MRRAAGHFATGVTVVTTRSEESGFHGLTMNAVASLSLNPSLFLICIDRRSGSLPALLESGVFAINILSRQQERIAGIFASKTGDKFAEVAYHIGSTGAPLLEGALSTVDCRVTATYPGGDHTIVLGQVEDLEINEGEPLLFYRGEYAGVSL